MGILCSYQRLHFNKYFIVDSGKVFLDHMVPERGNKNGCLERRNGCKSFLPWPLTFKHPLEYWRLTSPLPAMVGQKAAGLTFDPCLLPIFPFSIPWAMALGLLIFSNRQK